MEGPYCWRPPNYWFSGKYPATFGSAVEQGDNEHIPTLESLKKFIPADKLWPINDTWFMHAGAWGGNSTLSNIRLALNNRYGPSTNVEDFVRKAQLAHYENTRAQFENVAASGWATHKMVGYWMLNSHWPSFYGNLIDYYLSPGGAYYGAKKGLRPLSVVFDYYATGDNSQARIIVFNQTPGDVRGLRVRVRIYDLDGKVRDDRSTNGIAVPFNGATQVMALPRYPESSPVFFVRCQLFDDSGKLVVDNTYWQSQKDDDLGARAHDMVMTLRQDKWADMTALNTMPPAAVEIEGDADQDRQREPRHHPFAQSIRAHRIFRAGHNFHGARRQRNSSDRIRRQLHHRLSRRNRRDSRNRSEGRQAPLGQTRRIQHSRHFRADQVKCHELALKIPAADNYEKSNQ